MDGPLPCVLHKQIKDWYDVKAPAVFAIRNAGKTLVTIEVFWLSLGLP